MSTSANVSFLRDKITKAAERLGESEDLDAIVDQVLQSLSAEERGRLLDDAIERQVDDLLSVLRRHFERERREADKPPRSKSSQVGRRDPRLDLDDDTRRELAALRTEMVALQVEAAKARLAALDPHRPPPPEAGDREMGPA